MSNQTIGIPGTDRSIDHLNSFLRGEISACETYRMAIAKLEGEPFRVDLEQCLVSHEVRCDDLRRRIRLMGGTPAESSGMWGAFAKLIEGGAKAFGPRVAIAALESGEDHGLADYKRDVIDLDTESRAFVLTHLIPEQEKSHATMSRLKHSFH